MDSNIEMLWDLLGCAIVFYIKWCTDYCCIIEVKQCVYLIAPRGQESLVISLRVTENSYDCSLSMQSGSRSTFCFAKHFPGSVQTVVCAVYTV